MLLWLWSKIQSWALLAGAALLILFGAYAAGGRAARKTADLERRKNALIAKEKSYAVLEEVSSLDSDAALDRAARWVRRDKR